MKPSFLLILITFTLSISSNSLASNFFLSGHYRNLLVYSKTELSKEDYYFDSNRLRIEAKGEPSNYFSYNMQYDNNAVFGDYLATEEFSAFERASQSIVKNTYWILDHEIKKEKKLRWNHSIYRGYGELHYKSLDLKVGRQRVPWGKGWFWSPLDMFNPVASTATERDERKGVDGALMTISGGTVSSFSLLYLPQRENRDSTALRIVGQLGSYDIALSAGTHMERVFGGIDFAGYIGDAGLYGEIVTLEDNKGNQELSLLLSGNYNFENSLYIMAEYFSNGGWNAPWTGISYEGEDYAGIEASYDLTPLSRWNNFLIINLDDRSYFFSPKLTSSLLENLDLSLGLQIFGGNKKGEYGQSENRFYSDLEWYF